MEVFNVMKTECIEIDSNNPEEALCYKAAKVIINSGLVAFPTETVYGLGANAFDVKAVRKIFAAKERPFEDPLIIHISDLESLSELARDIPPVAFKLAEKFWPGPLTLILKKKKKVPVLVTGGLDTVAVRMPKNKIALSLIECAGKPICAPSANLFGRISPTRARHVLQDLDGKIDMVIDGGTTLIGVESTIIDLTQDVPQVLRPGGISYEKLKNVTPFRKSRSHKRILSPGMYKSHYAPKAKLVLADGKGDAGINEIRRLADQYRKAFKNVGIVSVQEHKEEYPGFTVKTLGPGNNLTVCAANLYAVLRELDVLGVDIILSESFHRQGLGAAIMDRLKKASGV